MLHDYLVWPFNLGNCHWVVAVMKTAPGSTIYYCDSMNGTDLEQEKASVPANLHWIMSIVGDSVNPPERKPAENFRVRYAVEQFAQGRK